MSDEFPEFFDGVGRIGYDGPDTDNPLAFRWYDADRVVAGRRMARSPAVRGVLLAQLRWDGFDIFGAGTLDRRGIRRSPGADPMAAAEQKMDAAFEFFDEARRAVLLLPRPRHRARGRDVQGVGREPRRRWSTRAAEHQERTGVELLWGTANLFSNRALHGRRGDEPRSRGVRLRGRPGRPLPRSHASPRWPQLRAVGWARGLRDAAQHRHAARARPARRGSSHLVVEHKHRIGFDGTILIEPKPFEPTKHQYDYDVAAVYAFLQRYDLADEIKVNIEVNHATLAGHDFAHEIAAAVNAGIFGSIDANAGDDRLGWDVDRFPVSVEQMTLGDARDPARRRVHDRRAQLRRQAAPPVDRPRPTCSTPTSAAWTRWPGRCSRPTRSSTAASSTLRRDARYAGWDGDLGKQLLAGKHSLADLRTRANTARRATPLVGSSGTPREHRQPAPRHRSLTFSRVLGRRLRHPGPPRLRTTAEGRT